MKKLLLSALLLNMMVSVVIAQNEEKSEEKKGFKLDNLFTGGSISLGFSTYSFTVGGSPVFGYNITKWLDAGIVVNYNYQSNREIYTQFDKIHQTQYGGGGFVKIYPVNFLFAQAQFEHNFATQKYFPGEGGTSSSIDFQTNSLLVGGGYAGRMPGFKEPFFYLAILFDVSGNPYTPYTTATGAAIPILKGGIQIPLFQGKKKSTYDEYDEPRQGGGKKPRNYNRY